MISNKSNKINYKIINKYNQSNQSIKFNQQGGNYNLCVYNVELNKIEYINEVKFDLNPHLYIILGNETKKKLAKENTENIIEKIKANGEDKFYNVGINPIEYIRDDYLNKESWLGANIYHNPYGLWFGCGADWQKYINIPSQWAFSTHLYEIEINSSVLKISSVEELEEFIEKYKNSLNNLSFTNVINWDNVKEDYDGLVICPYLGDKIWGENANQMSIRGNTEAINSYIKKIAGDSWEDNIVFNAEWYRHWETGSGVVWRASGIKDFKLVDRLTTFDNLDLDNLYD